MEIIGIKYRLCQLIIYLGYFCSEESYGKNHNKNIIFSSTLIGLYKMHAKPNLYFEMLSSIWAFFLIFILTAFI